MYDNTTYSVHICLDGFHNYVSFCCCHPASAPAWCCDWKSERSTTFELWVHLLSHTTPQCASIDEGCWRNHGMLASKVFWNFARPKKERGWRGKGEARHVGEIHNSNSNLQMKHGKTVALMVSTCATTLLPLVTDVLQHSIQYRGLSTNRRGASVETADIPVATAE